MKTEHTPAPWSIDEHAQIIGGKSVLGRVYSGDFFPNDDLPECTANAKLIAASPELLDALIKTCESLEQYAAHRKDKGTATSKINAWNNLWFHHDRMIKAINKTK